MTVSLTLHATQRCRDRGISVEQAKRDVADAAAAGRRAKAKPRWAWLPDHGRSAGANARKDGTYRYLWDAGEERAYLCVRTAVGWRIVTVLLNHDRAVA